MENEIRKAAMRPFTSVEPMFPGSLLDDDGQKPVICRILDVARSAAYYREHDRIPIVDEVMAQRIKHLIDADPALAIGWSGLDCADRASRSTATPCSVLCSLKAGSATVVSRSVVLRGLSQAQASHWYPTFIGPPMPHTSGLDSMAWSTSTPCWIVPIASASASTSANATMLGKRPGDSTDNALVYASELYRDLAQSYGLHQEFILPHTPEQNRVTKSFMGTLKLECV